LDLSVNSPEIKGKSRTIGPSPTKKIHFCLNSVAGSPFSDDQLEEFGANQATFGLHI
jgi:hypothetical protein